MTTTHTEIEAVSLTDLVPYEDDGNKDRLTHMVSPPENMHITQGDPNMEAQDVVDTARLTGQEVIALCGHKWVPKHDPDKYDMCQMCIEIAGMIMRGLGE